jgi:hypothetical protein
MRFLADVMAEYGEYLHANRSYYEFHIGRARGAGDDFDVFYAHVLHEERVPHRGNDAHAWDYEREHLWSGRGQTVEDAVDGIIEEAHRKVAEMSDKQVEVSKKAVERKKRLDGLGARLKGDAMSTAVESYEAEPTRTRVRTLRS